MRHLVGDGGGDGLPVALGGEFGIDQQAVLEQQDRAPVLHGAEARRARRADQVELGQGIAHTEIVVVVAQQLAGPVQGVGRLVPGAAAHHHAHVDAVHRAADPLKVAHAQEQQVARHPGRGLEGDALQPARQRLDPGLRHVGDRHLALRRRDGELEGRLLRRLVPAGDEAAGVHVLELGDQHPLPALRRVVVEGEQAGGAGIDPAAIVDDQQVSAPLDGAAKVQAGGFGGRIEGDLGGRRAVQRCAVQVQIRGVEHDGPGRSGHVHGDGDMAAEAHVRGVGHDGDAVGHGDDSAGQAHALARPRRDRGGLAGWPGAGAGDEHQNERKDAGGTEHGRHASVKWSVALYDPAWTTRASNCSRAPWIRSPNARSPTRCWRPPGRRRSSAP